MHFVRRVAISIVLASCLTVILVALLFGMSRQVVASVSGAILYVATTGADGGNDCTSSAMPCATIQAAVDAASDGDEIRVASGTYTGTQTTISIVFSNEFTTTQVVLITRNLTLRGGYTTSDWSISNPISNPTVIDAERGGRGISLVGTGSQSMTVEGFTITGGDYTGLGNKPGLFDVCIRTSSDCGGGLFAYYTQAIVRSMVFTNNIAHRADGGGYGDGGGLYLWQTTDGSLIENTTIISNAAWGASAAGGGARITFGEGVTISNSTFISNTAAASGGGLQVFQPSGTIAIEATDFLDNSSEGGSGGALEARIAFDGLALRMNRVRMQGNRARSQGAAIRLIAQGVGVARVEFTNLILADNDLTVSGSTKSVISAESGSAKSLDLHMSHVTIAENLVPGALRLDTSLGQPATATLTNTLVTSAPAGFIANQGSGALLIQHTNILTWNVDTLHTTESGSPNFVDVNTLSGDPKLDATYHLQPGSAAIDAGIDAGVATDIDGEQRPAGALPDIGADEFSFKVLLPIVLRES